MVLAQVEGLGGLDTLVQYGVLGIFAFILVIFANNAYKREMKRADNAEAEVARLNGVIQDRVVPALETASRALRDSQALISDITQEREVEARATRTRVQRLEAEIGGAS